MPEDQTDPPWITEYGIEALGTGVFLKSGERDEEWKLKFARNISYARCGEIARQEECSAFKWIPLEVAAYAEVIGSRCAAEGEPCKLTCKGLACLCDPTRRVCVSKISGGGGKAVESELIRGANQPAEV